MINFKLLYKIIGQLLFLEASLMIACLMVAFFYQEDDIFAFTVSAFITILFGLVLKIMGKNASNSLSRRDAYLVVSVTWIIFSLQGTMPFLIGGYITNFTDAFFESMSGFTTTGATVFGNVEALPHATLFWRSLSQWIGGLGIVFFTIALLPSLVGGSVKVFAAEATGPIRTKLHPRLSTSSKWIWSVYIVITIACIISYYFAGGSIFSSINYAMTTTATGGFAIHNSSAEFFNTPLLEYLCTFFCLLSGVNFTLLYCAVIKGKVKNLFRSTEFRFYITLILLLSLFVMAQLMMFSGYSMEKAFRSGIFQVVSFITTTGILNDDAALWPHATWVALALCMVIGGCSGSTSGGMKCIRAVMMLRVIKNEFRQILHPNAVLPLKIDGVNVPHQKRVTLLAFLTIYLLLAMLQGTILIGCGIDNTNAIAITASCLGNVGASLGVAVGPSMSWASLPVFAKWLCAAMMLVGRLEVFSVLVIFTPEFWKKN